MRELNLVGERCPLPIVRLNSEIRSLNAGEEIVVLASDRAFELDVQAWCRRTGHALVDFQDLQGVYRAQLRKVG
ncbi:MAG: sulfurtransferase TusA family protein [Gammaproteobacteria bacterium]